MLIKVKVKLNSSKQEIIKTEEGYLAYLKEKAKNNKANLELIKLLKKHFDKEVRIKSGLKNKNKIIEIK